VIKFLILDQKNIVEYQLLFKGLGGKKIVIKRATRAIPPDTKKEAPKEICCASKLMAGPNIKPKPKAAPKYQKLWLDFHDWSHLKLLLGLLNYCLSNSI